MPIDPAAPKKVERKLAAILAADVVGYSRLMGADEEDTFARLKAHRRELIDPEVASHHGRVVKLTGDGALIEFPSVVEAVRCAVRIQHAIADRNAQIAPEKRIEIRIGINLGDVIVEDGDIYGDGVNIAARLEAIAEPGGICISARVLDEIRSKVDLAFEDLGERQLKNIAHPVRVFHVRTSEALAFRGQSTIVQTLALPGKPSIAILPFTNMSADPDHEFFGDGIAEDVLAELSKLRWLFVIARNSSFTYKGKAVDIKHVGRELGVRYVLEGSVRRSGNRVRVTAQLIDTISGAHVWADRYDRELNDIFAVQDEITAAVATAIGPAISAAEQYRAVRKTPESLDGWEAYQRGMWHFSKSTAADIAVACEYFQKAITLDPNFGLALTALSSAMMNSAAAYHNMPYSDAARAGEALARKALSLDPSDANAYARIGWAMFMRGDLREAILQSKEALRIDPNSEQAIGLLGASLVLSGDFQEGREFLLAALRLSPRDPSRPVKLMQVGVSYYLEENYRLAEDVLRQLVRQYPSFSQGYRWLIATLGRLDKTDEATALIKS